MISAKVINTKAICSSRGFATSTGAVIVSVTVSTDISGSPSEESGRFYQKHDRHDDEHDRVRSLGIKHLRQAFDDAEHEAGDDRAAERPHAADDDRRQHHED